MFIQVHQILIRQRAVDSNHRRKSHLFSKQRLSPNRFTLYELTGGQGGTRTPNGQGQLVYTQSASGIYIPTHLAVPTGVEPASIDLKDRRLYQFAYGTKTESF